MCNTYLISHVPQTVPPEHPTLILQPREGKVYGGVQLSLYGVRPPPPPPPHTHTTRPHKASGGGVRSQYFTTQPHAQHITSYLVQCVHVHIGAITLWHSTAPRKVFVVDHVGHTSRLTCHLVHIIEIVQIYPDSQLAAIAAASTAAATATKPVRLSAATDSGTGRSSTIACTTRRYAQTHTNRDTHIHTHG